MARLFAASAAAPGRNNLAMKPTLERSDQVVAHVVAWHNRHPLAQRITADQVHSVGVVSLPYAVRGAQQQPVVPGPMPDAAAPSEPVLTDAAVPQPPQDPQTAAPAEPAAEAATEVAIEAVVEFEADAAAAPDAAALPSTDAAPEASILDRALAAADAPAPVQAAEGPPPAPAPAAEPPQTAAAPTVDAALPMLSNVTGLPGRPADLPSRPRPWHPLTWWARLRGRLPFHALFSEDFIAPLRPRQVRPWVARHGVGRRPLEPQAPQRLIVLDATRRRPDDDATEVDLHVITAAIGVDDGRHRLLLSPDGAVLGRRRWSRPRVAAAAGSVVAVLAGVGGGWMWRSGAHGAEAIAQHAAPASASAASAAASAVAVAVAHAASQPASSADVAAAAASAASPSSAHPVAQATEAAPPHASAHAPAAAGASAPPSTHAATEPASAPDAAVAAAPPEAVASVPRSVNPRRGRIELPPLVPKLAATERHDLRTNSRELRGQPAVLPEAKAWALVTGPLADRRQSERVAAQLHAVALLQPVPMRAELMPAGNGWRAVFWPFPTAQDAEKVRLALADKGLRTEVLEF